MPPIPRGKQDFRPINHRQSTPAVIDARLAWTVRRHHTQRPDISLTNVPSCRQAIACKISAHVKVAARKTLMVASEAISRNETYIELPPNSSYFSICFLYVLFMFLFSLSQQQILNLLD